MKVKYVGMFDAIEVAELADPRGFRVSVKRGEVVEVDDELGERLVAQEENWVVEGEKGRKGEREKAGVEAPVADGGDAGGITPSEG
mgnify:CR=1 FL=1